MRKQAIWKGLALVPRVSGKPSSAPLAAAKTNAYAGFMAYRSLMVCGYYTIKRGSWFVARGSLAAKNAKDAEGYKLRWLGLSLPLRCCADDNHYSVPGQIGFTQRHWAHAEAQRVS